MKKKLLLVLAVFLMVSCFLWSSLSADSLHVRKVVSVVYDDSGSIYFAPTASFDLLDRAYHLAMQENMKAVVANVFTSDKFYDDALDQKKKLLSAYGVAAIDMETCELYSLAAKHGIDALTIMTVSDNLIMSLKDVQPKSGRHPLTT